MIKLYRRHGGSQLIKTSPAYKTGFLYSEDSGASWRRLSHVLGYRFLKSGNFTLLGNNYKRKR